MHKYIPVKGYSGLVRDTETNALINTNASEIELARERKLLKKQKLQEEKAFQEKVETLEKDVFEIKKMLSLLLEKV